MHNFLLWSFISPFPEQTFSFFHVSSYLILTKLGHNHFFNFTNIFIRRSRLITKNMIYMAQNSLQVKEFTCESPLISTSCV